MRIIRFIAQDNQIHHGSDLGNGTAQLLKHHPTKSLVLDKQVLEIKELMAPIDPPTIFCIGKNYAEHAREFGSDIPTQPIIFIKPITTLNHPNRPVKIPACLTHGPETDYEAELAIVIGKQGVNIKEEDAHNHILGYTCANDVTARRMQKHAGGDQWARGKGFDGFPPPRPSNRHTRSNQRCTQPKNQPNSQRQNNARWQHLRHDVPNPKTNKLPITRHHTPPRNSHHHRNTRRCRLRPQPTSMATKRRHHDRQHPRHRGIDQYRHRLKPR